MNEETSASPPKVTPPYLSPVTFYNFIEAHRRTLPDRIDRSLMTNVSGTDQPRILSALRFFGLTNDDGYTQSNFQKLREVDEETLKSAWAALLRSSYQYLFEGFNLAQATQGQIEERFREQNIKGDTVRKGVAFFVAMARNAGIELSPYIKATRLRGSSGPKERKARSGNAGRNNGGKGGSGQKTPPVVTDGQLGSLAATWRLPNGVVARFYVNGDTFGESKTDRDNLFKIADTLKKYDSESPASKKARPTEDGAAES